LVVFNEKDPKWVTIEKIVVPTEFDKEQLIRAFKYLHDNRTIDTDLLAVNTIVHMYENTGLIVVDNQHGRLVFALPDGCEILEPEKR
jgi:hypothetical protein